MKKLSITILLVCVCFLSTGCVINNTSVIKGRNDIYSTKIKEGNPKIVLADLEDTRADKKLVGRVCAVNLKTDTPINALLTDSIATRLGNKGFNVEKKDISNINNKAEIKKVLDYTNGDVLISGDMSHFYVESFDAVLDKAKGDVSFSIAAYDKDGNEIYEKSFVSHSENWIGLTGPYGNKKSIELALDSSVEELFDDKSFNDFLAKVRRQN